KYSLYYILLKYKNQLNRIPWDFTITYYSFKERKLKFNFSQTTNTSKRHEVNPEQNAFLEI
ncbi:hypothetical protein, partial [Borreliella garinii]|uniref:hypothetical protein n=1 Tax=Borreliella garinii TaxID=29519 RepID=UPI001AEFD984